MAPKPVPVAIDRTRFRGDRAITVWSSLAWLTGRRCLRSQERLERTRPPHQLELPLDTPGRTPQ